jgi:hypothetical protein
MIGSCSPIKPDNLPISREYVASTRSREKIATSSAPHGLVQSQGGLFGCADGLRADLDPDYDLK